MEKDKKYRIKLSEQAEKAIDDELDNEARRKLAEVFKKIKEDPYTAGTPIITTYDKKTLERLVAYKEKPIERIQIWGDPKKKDWGSLGRGGVDFDLEIERMLICLYGAKISKNNRELFLPDLKEPKEERGLYFLSASYQEGYRIEITTTDDTDKFLITAQGISFSPVED